MLPATRPRPPCHPVPVLLNLTDDESRHLFPAVAPKRRCVPVWTRFSPGGHAKGETGSHSPPAASWPHRAPYLTKRLLWAER